MKVERSYLLCEFERSPVEAIRLTVSEYRRRRYLDLRLWFCNEHGEWKPTKKGCTVGESEFDRLKSAIDLAKAVPVKPVGETTEMEAAVA